MKAIKIAALLGLVLLVVIPAVEPARARTWYVLPDGSGDAPTIQAAIDSCGDYDTVLVAAGMYLIDSGAGTYSLDGLCLLGEDGAENTILDAGGQDLQFTFMNTENGLSIKGLTFQFFADNPLYIHGVWNYSGAVVIEETVFRYHGGCAIIIYYFDDAVIRNNLIYSNDFGIRLNFCTLADVSQNTIAYTIQTGIEVPTNWGIQNISNNLVVDNYYGIFGYYQSMNFSCNNVYNNALNYNLPGGTDPTGFDGNISLDAQFCSATPRTDGNFYLQSDSPCAPGNHPVAHPCGRIGVYPVGCSTTAVETKSWGAIKNMYR